VSNYAQTRPFRVDFFQTSLFSDSTLPLDSSDSILDTRPKCTLVFQRRSSPNSSTGSHKDDNTYGSLSSSDVTLVNTRLTSLTGVSESIVRKTSASSETNRTAQELWPPSLARETVAVAATAAVDIDTERRYKRHIGILSASYKKCPAL